jgi:hypothetical protein
LAISLEERFRLDAQRIERAEEILKRAQLEVAMRHAEDGIPVSAAHGRVLSTKRDEVFLRHRSAKYLAGSGVSVSVSRTRSLIAVEMLEKHD